jgi:hypothetical protein
MMPAQIVAVPSRRWPTTLSPRPIQDSTEVILARDFRWVSTRFQHLIDGVRGNPFAESG